MNHSARYRSFGNPPESSEWQPLPILHGEYVYVHLSATTYTSARQLNETQPQGLNRDQATHVSNKSKSITGSIVQNTASVCNPSKCPESIAQAIVGPYRIPRGLALAPGNDVMA